VVVAEDLGGAVVTVEDGPGGATVAAPGACVVDVGGWPASPSPSSLHAAGRTSSAARSAGRHDALLDLIQGEFGSVAAKPSPVPSHFPKLGLLRAPRVDGVQRVALLGERGPELGDGI
jgi:hypothetical protein